MFTEKDKKQIKDKGLSLEKVERQLENFRKGFPNIEITKPAHIGDGLKKTENERLKHYITKHDELREKHSILKFVPASGAASRMFKDLFSFINDYSDQDDLDKIINDGNHSTVNKLINNIKKFAFFDDLEKILTGKGTSTDKLLNEKKYVTLIKYIIGKDGLFYGYLPKGLIKFHKYNNNTRTSFEEHLIEGANYTLNNDKTIKLHFTVSGEHLQLFESHVNDIRKKYEEQFDASYEIDFSLQKPSTDTIAVDMNNEPFRNEDGSLLFRPGGHGALLDNLNNIHEECIYIKNIDNVTVDRLKEDTYTYKKVLGGLLFEYKEKIFHFLNKLEKGDAENQIIQSAEQFLKNDLNILPPGDYNNKTSQEKINYLIKKLNRPIRVCGMVQSEGDTGGGPFWAVNPDGSQSLQILETAQIDLENKNNKEIFNQSTHFSPADFALFLYDYKGNKFNLHDFVNPDTGFITKKSKDGKELKAQELPGLWNGSMADWNTIFVEVPISTFTPVKKITDLVEENHQEMI